MKHKDIFGKALLDYMDNLLKSSNQSSDPEDILTWTNITDVDTLPVSYLFRNFQEMPTIEKIALEKSYGKILDVGCGAGGHSLYLQNKGHNVTAIDISEGAVMTSKRRGVKKVKQINILDVKESYDTILLLMNGTGIFQKYDHIQNYLKHLKSILNPGGQILIDSSDIKYMFDEDVEKFNSKGEYYGELDYYISYRGEEEVPMNWLYLDFDTLNECCLEAGLNCDKLLDGNHFDYLARITVDDK